MNKKNLIDGLPASYDHNYVIKTEKQCPLCCKAITPIEIEGNSIVCTESFDFMHKKCVDTSDLELVFSKPNDPTSMVRVSKKR
jgi:hypothetical protein